MIADTINPAGAGASRAFATKDAVRVYVALNDAVAVLSSDGDGWRLDLRFDDSRKPVCIAVDPHRPERVYCGTWDDGLWISDDAARTWRKAGPGITHERIMAVAVSRAERGENGNGVVWAGTEPSALFCSRDGGETWTERPALLDLPSRPTWSFPPRPHTHHVRWIEPDPLITGRLFVAIEQGGVMRTLDNGETWEDHKPGGQRDGHTLATHVRAPGRVYEAAGGESARFKMEPRLAWPPLRPNVIITGGGYAQSRDGGETWETQSAGLEENYYLWGLAVDSGDPDTLVASASVGPMRAHQANQAESFVIRRTKNEPWRRVPPGAGLPDPAGTVIPVLASDPAAPGVFYAASNQGVFRSADAGETWKPLVPETDWPTRFRKQHVQGIAVAGGGGGVA